MEKLRKDLLARGKEVQFVAINGLSALDHVHKLTAKTEFPILQDNDESAGWAALGGEKDDFYLYGSDGLLAVRLPVSGTWATHLEDPEGGWAVLSSVLEEVK